MSSKLGTKRPQEDAATAPAAGRRTKRIKSESGATVVGVTKVGGGAMDKYVTKTKGGAKPKAKTASASASASANGGGAEGSDGEGVAGAEMTEAELAEKRETEARIRDIPLLSIHRTM